MPDLNWAVPTPLAGSGLGQLAFDKETRVLAASRVADVAIESNTLRHGPLTYVLTQEALEVGLADEVPRDGEIYLREPRYAEAGCRS